VIGETLETLQVYFNNARLACEEIRVFVAHLKPVDLDVFDNVKVIDSFIFRFIKIQDMMVGKLFREVLMAVGEYGDSMTALDVLDKMEKIDLIESASAWVNYRNLRNELTHEYPGNREEIINGIKLSLDVFDEIEIVYEKIKSYLVEKGIASF